MSNSSSLDTSRRYFSPIILFHDTALSGQSHVQPYQRLYTDPEYTAKIEWHKRRIDRMMDYNCRVWMDHCCNNSNKPSSPELSSASSLSPPPSTRLHISSTTPPATPPTLDTALPTVTTTKRHASAGQKLRRRRGNLPKNVTAILRDWLSKHKKHPYPTEDEKTELADRTNLTLNQVSNWFINARRRILGPMLKENLGSGATAVPAVLSHKAKRHHDDMAHDQDEPDEGDTDHDLEEDEEYRDTMTSTRRSQRRFNKIASRREF